ncbi:MAG: hypothetical protein QGI87_04690 [Candidatus Bathyarchaeota archaeon]|nr:hypothetical protein [Candidatus Bathyarchaeota archaeon]
MEVPCLVDETGIQPIFVVDLPPQCAALNRTKYKRPGVRGLSSRKEGQGTGVPGYPSRPPY